METLMKADVFFFITAVAVVIATGGFLVAVYFFIKTLRDIQEFVKEVRIEAEHIIDDVAHVRNEVTSKMKMASKFISALASTAFVHKIFSGDEKKSSRRTSKSNKKSTRPNRATSGQET